MSKYCVSILMTCRISILRSSIKELAVCIYFMLAFFKKWCPTSIFFYLLADLSITDFPFSLQGPLPAPSSKRLRRASWPNCRAAA